MPGPLLCKMAHRLKVINDVNGLAYMHSRESEAQESVFEHEKFAP